MRPIVSAPFRVMVDTAAHVVKKEVGEAKQEDAKRSARNQPAALT